MKLRAESITAAAASLTAIAALAIAAWDNVQTRAHNRLSVAPRLTIDLVVETTDSGKQYSITVRNDGIGPAVLYGMKLRFYDRNATVTDSSWARIAARFADEGMRVPATWEFTSGETIGVGRSYTLISIVQDSPAGRSADQTDGGSRQPPGSREESVSANELIDRLGIVIEYASIYGEESRATFNWKTD